MSSRSITLLSTQTLTATTTTTADTTPINTTEAFTAELIIGGPVTGTTPTLNVVVQTTEDPNNASGWFTVATFAQQTSTPAAPITQAIAAGVLGRAVRVVATVGGTTPSFGAVEVVIG